MKAILKYVLTILRLRPARRLSREAAMKTNDLTPAETARRVSDIVERFVWPEEQRAARDAIVELLIDVQQAMAGAAMQAHREGLRLAVMEAAK